MTHEPIAIAPDLRAALRAASERGGAVWRENVDNRGRPLGSPSCSCRDSRSVFSQSDCFRSVSVSPMPGRVYARCAGC